MNSPEIRYKVCNELIGYCREYPGIQVVVIAGYDLWFDEIFLPQLFRVVRQDSREFEYDRKHQNLTFNNGSRLRWKAYDSPDMIKGWEAHVIWFIRDTYRDEIIGKVRAIEESVHQRLRTSAPSYPKRWIVSDEEE